MSRDECSHPREPEPPSAAPTTTLASADRSVLLATLAHRTRATLVEAPPGQGKSSLVRTWTQELERQGVEVLWIDATPEAEPCTFAAWLGSALGHRRVPARPVRQRQHPDTESAGDNAWSELAHRIAARGEDLVLVVDDLQRVQDPRIEEGLLQLVRGAPRLKLVLICTAWTYPDLAGALSPLGMTYVAGRSLLVTPPEGRRLARTWGHTVEEGRALELHDLTGGWLLPMRLVLEASDRDTPGLSTSTAREFFRDRVIPPLLAAHDRPSVLRLCLPGLLTETLVRHLADLSAQPVDGHGSSPRELVGLLEEQGFLIRAGGAEPTWRFPTLLREELVANLTQGAPVFAREMHRSLAHFYASEAASGQLREALVHARRAEDWSLLDRLWTSHGSDLLLQSPAGSLEAYASVPDGVATTSPILSLARTIVRQTPSSSSRAEHRQRIRAYVQEGRRALAKLGSFTSLPDLLSGTAAAMLSLRYEGAWSHADELGSRLAAAVHTRPQPEESRVMGRRLAWFFIQWGLTLAHMGQWQHAVDQLTRAYDYADGAASRTLSSCAAAHLALVHALVGIPRDARRWLDLHGALDASDHWPASLATTPALVSDALLALDGLDEDTASRSIVAMREDAEPPDMAAFVGFARAQHALIFGDPVAGLLHLDHLATHRAALLSDGCGGTQLFARSRADLLLATGELNRAAQHITDHEHQSSWLRTSLAQLHLMAGNHALAREIASSGVWDADVRLRDRVDLLSLKAGAALVMGDDSAAHEAFIASHRLAREHGVLRAHSILPRDVRAELHSRTGLTWPSEQQARLAAVVQVFPDRGELVELTERESVVLTEMAKHHTLADVAAALTVSPNTVKKQTASLYGKLGVHDRESALIRAYQLGLLPTGAPRITRSPLRD